MKYAAGLILIVLAGIAGLGTLDGQFISDDFLMLHRAPALAFSDIVLGNWLGEHGHGGFYRPMLILSWKLDYFLYGFDGRGYHATNILLHILTVLLVALIITRIERNGRLGLIAGLLFALHPVHTEVIAWLSGRTDSVAAVFFLSSFFLAIPTTTNKHRSFAMTLLSLIFALFAFASKEITYTLPILVFVFAITDTNAHRRFRDAVRISLPTAVLLLLFLLLRFASLGDFVGGYGADQHLRLDGTLLDHIQNYLRWLISPITLNFKTGSVPWRLLLTVSWLFMGAALWSPRHRNGPLWCCVTCIPVLTLCREQYLYIPSIGFVWLISSIICHEILRPESRTRWVTAVLSILILLTGYTFKVMPQNAAWRYSGKVAATILDVLAANHPDIRDESRIVMISPPVNHTIGFGVFQQGLTDAVQLKFKNKTLTTRIESSRRTFVDHHPETDIVILFEGGRMIDFTGLFPDFFTRFTSLNDSATPIRLSAENPMRRIVPEAVSVDAIEIWSCLANSSMFAQGEPIADIRIACSDGHEVMHEVKAGIGTSEWAWDRPDIRARVRHQRACVIESQIGNADSSGGVPSHTYRERIPFDSPRTITEITFSSRFTGPVAVGDPPVYEVRKIYGIRSGS